MATYKQELKELNKGDLVGHFPCVANEIDNKEACNSSDGMAVYIHEEDGTIYYDAHCFSCKQNFSRKELVQTSMKSELDLDQNEQPKQKKRKFGKKKAEPLSLGQVKDFIKEIGYESGDYRGIKDEYSKFYGHLTKLDGKGKVIARYYPETQEGKVTGYKCRNHPKDFSHGKIGVTGSSCELSGQVKFKSGGKYVLLVGGEEDKVAAFQMLEDSKKQRGRDDLPPVAVVSPTVGETGCEKQIKAQYEWFDKFDIIVVGFDSDEAGQKAAKEIAKHLPREKVKIASWTGKDPNQMLKNKKEKQFVRDFYQAKDLVNTGIIKSSNIMDSIKEELLRPRISLPDYMRIVQENTRGGLLQGRIINIIGDTSVGKSTHVNGMEYHWIFNAPVKTGVVSLEATAGQYGLDILSLHLEKNLSWEVDGSKTVEYLDNPEVQALYQDLWMDEVGEDRFAILDERDGDIKILEHQIQTLVKQHGCGIIIIDVLSDILRGLTLEEQASHMMFQKNLIKSGVTIVNVLHTRKPPASRDGVPQKATEYDALGSSSFVQSAAINIVINRNKMCACPIERNTTYVDMPKARGGITGKAGEWYYDPETRKVYDRRQYFKDNPEKLPYGYDLDISSFDKEWYKEGGNCENWSNL